MKNPSDVAELATDFYIDLQTVRNSVNGAAIISTINTAAAANTSVTDAEYDEYIQYTAWRFPSFVQHNALTS